MEPPWRTEPPPLLGAPSRQRFEAVHLMISEAVREKDEELLEQAKTASTDLVKSK